MKKIKALVASCLAMAMLVGCGGNTSTDGLRFVFTFDSPAKSLDSTVATDGTSFTCIAQFDEGLYMKDADGNLSPCLAAEEAEVSDDGLVYTFKIRDDAKWSNGADVTANDFVYAWQRILKNGGEYAYMFGADGANMLNGSEIVAGEMDASELGAVALDDKTLQVTLAGPCGFFLDLMSFPIFYPQNEAFIEEVGETNYATSADTLLSCGPFVVTEYVPGNNKVVYEKNEDYWDADSVQLTELEIDMAVTSDTATMGFSSGDYDFVNIGYELVDNYVDDEAFYSYPAGYQYYIALNFLNEDLQNINIRKAISYAIDRDDIADNVLGDGSLAAVALDPQELSYKDGVDFTDGMDYLHYDLATAQEYLDAGLEELGVDSITLELLYGNDEAPCDALATYVQSALEKLDGITLTVETKSKNARLDDMENHDFDIAITRWGPDYADPMTYLTLFSPKTNMSDTSYSNDAYQAMLDRISVETDPDTRWELMKEAEDMLMNDYACVPLIVKSGVALMNTDFDFDSIGLYPTGPNILKFITKAE